MEQTAIPPPAHLGVATADAGLLTEPLAAFLASHEGPTPFLALDRAVVAERYHALAESLPGVRLFYAVKANPDPAILRCLVALGASFDVASLAEVEACLDAGAEPDDISYGSTIKPRSGIAMAQALGVTKYAVDSHEELDKVLEEAPGSDITVRLLHECEGSDWPLSRKFGCHPDLAVDLAVRAHRAGCRVGLSFHVGSQQRRLSSWDDVLVKVGAVIARVAERGAKVSLLNLGGGFPGRYREDAPAIDAYGEAIRAAVARHLPDDLELMAEPGRYLVADAGVFVTRVVLASRRGPGPRWVYLDAGVFSGLFEAFGEAIKYRLTTDVVGPTEPVVIAGPTCDSTDVLYERSGYELPVALTEGDRVLVLSAGAYTTVYSTSGFNGFQPPPCYVL